MPHQTTESGLNSTEINRKLIHLSSLLYPALYLMLDDHKTMLIITASICALLISSEILRRYVPSFCRLYNQLLRFTLRPQEQHRITGATYFLVGVFLTIAMFDSAIAILALTILVISDTCASLIGITFGRFKLIDNKSLAGTLAFVVSALCICAIGAKYFALPLFPLMFAAIAASLFELFSTRLRLDDNILIPLGFAATATILM